eukprot:TRINITY_DN4053_c0_g1_i5.p1 TRINITY_DN4053_c0_g1~~TRINITY_DN4053_c0_g1_i5.p1  ORF type:complete len:296 (+),score=45.11 TRINITY_DN4053_c0_g1_i5:749-1636(+)
MGGALGDAVFGQELKGHFLVDRGDRYTNEHPIYNFTYNKPGHPVQMSPNDWIHFPLELKKQHTKDSVLLRFQLPSVHGRMGGNVASFVLLRYKDTDGKYVVRPYTPVSMDWEFGHFDLLVKKYPDGKMGNHLDGLKIGDRIEVKGVLPKLEVQANDYAKIGLIAGGSGITPCWQVMMYLAKMDTNKTNCSLIYANHTPDDIMMKRSLNSLERNHTRMSIYHTVSKADSEWRGGLGRVNAQMIKSKMPAPGEGKILVCGPPAMMEAVCGKKDQMKQGPLGGMLKDMGYSEDDVFKF